MAGVSKDDERWRRTEMPRVWLIKALSAAIVVAAYP
jgi:hypothetical protein